MNVRDATPGDEPWLIETLDEQGCHDPGFRWYHYVVVTTDDGDRVGFGRLRERDADTAALTHVCATGDRPTLARAHAARTLVERAIHDGYDSVLVTAATTRPFEAVGFRERDEAESGPLPPGETAMVWVPASEREERGMTESEPAETDDELGGDDAPAQSAVTSDAANAEAPASERETDIVGEQSGSDDRRYKYDTAATTPETGDVSAERESTPADDDSTAAAARRQGFNPDAVNNKYDTAPQDGSRTAKYDTDGNRQSSGETAPAKEQDQSSRESDDDSRNTKYDTDDSDEAADTKYRV